MVKNFTDFSPTKFQQESLSSTRWISIAFFLIVASTLSFVVHAEGGCPTGQVPQEGNGWRSCVPINNGSPQPGPSDNFVGPRWTARWTSIAIDDIKPIVGKSGETRTQEQAESTAINDCAAQGGATCHTLVSTKNSCLAMIAGDTQVTYATRPTQMQAEAAAIEICISKPDTHCRVYFSACAKAVPE